LKLESEGLIAKAAGGKHEGRVLSGREKSVIVMRLSIEKTVKNSNGEIVPAHGEEQRKSSGW